MLYRDQNNSVTVAAPAKLNLFLKVLGKRSDGYHELETLMVSVGLYDSLRLIADPSGALSLTCRDAGRVSSGQPARELPPTDGGNLVLKAAELLRQAAGVPHGARLELTKRIPLAAGLAGGSSDAAAALVGLNRLWGLNLPPHTLHDLAARLGSDVPFFLCPTAAAICRGRGEIIEPLRLPLRLHFVIARPRSGLSTAEVFRNCRPSSIEWSAARLADACVQGRLDRVMRYLHNSLQEPAERLNREVTTLKGWFSRQPFLGHMMSGSGTSYFGLCRSYRQARQLAARLEATRLGDVFVARSRP
ncbi:MAG TPA: 4-(cytidine 5'-diphospho)-2-C-methyl-D-erythritol kinase [Planctomycetaceae bacterium]|jgi:4-diphosphocytidyl-2-C-methyl-D-erythritol kinase|nr:4-(cytidine 5'-diphospho)-2-C-methyl-D-erythritol kinase [Planctomycetaceae bacterium]